MQHVRTLNDDTQQAESLLVNGIGLGLEEVEQETERVIDKVLVVLVDDVDCRLERAADGGLVLVLLLLVERVGKGRLQTQQQLGYVGRFIRRSKKNEVSTSEPKSGWINLHGGFEDP